MPETQAFKLTMHFNVMRERTVAVRGGCYGEKKRERENRSSKGRLLRKNKEYCVASRRSQSRWTFGLSLAAQALGFKLYPQKGLRGPEQTTTLLCCTVW